MERNQQGMYRHHSHLAMNQKSSVRPATYNSSAEIFLLPDSVMEIIFKNLTYSELVKVRSVCHWFYYVIGSMLNQNFLLLSTSINEEIVHIKRSKRKSVHDGYLRILYILKLEVKMLEAHCLDYITGNMFFFYGGMIFDCIAQIMARKKCTDCSHLVSELFVLVDNFLDHFDSLIEPAILKRSIHLPFSWFGKKIVDILECYTNFEYQVSLTPNIGENHCKILGSYEAKQVSSLSPPPNLMSRSTTTRADMFTLLKYIRNHIRWNNVLNHINITDNNFENLDTEMWSQTTGDSKIIYNRKVQKVSDPSNKQSLTISLDLYCHKVLAPLKCRDNLGNIYVINSNKKMAGGESGVLLDTIPLKTSDYELSLTVEVVFKDKLDCGNKYKITTIQVCHLDDCCYIATNTDNLNQ